MFRKKTGRDENINHCNGSEERAGGEGGGEGTHTGEGPAQLSPYCETVPLSDLRWLL